TVGTSTEIYDYLKLLFARIGKTYSPISGQQVTKDTVTSVVEHIATYPIDTTLTIFAPLIPSNDRTLKEELSLLLHKGFVRVHYQGSIHKSDSLLEDDGIAKGKLREGEVEIVMDRVRWDGEEDTQHRIADSVQTAFFEGKGLCSVEVD